MSKVLLLPPFTDEDIKAWSLRANQWQTWGLLRESLAPELSSQTVGWLQEVDTG